MTDMKNVEKDKDQALTGEQMLAHLLKNERVLKAFLPLRSDVRRAKREDKKKTFD